MTKSRRRLQPVTPHLDAETRVTDDHHESLRMWLRLLACSNLIGNNVRQQLQSRFSTTLPRFDLLAQLERAPQGLKMGELTQRLMVTGGNVTGITDALEHEGLVVRDVDCADRRSFLVKLTKEGARQFRRMAAEHGRWVVALFDDLTGPQKCQLEELLSALKASVVRHSSQREMSSP